MSERIPAYILAGGKSLRFGSDKARAPIGPGGEPLIWRVAHSIAPLAEPVVIADRAGKYADLGLATIADVSPGLGPMAGLQAALHHCRKDWLLLLSCDLLVVQPHWIEQLLAARREELDAVAFKNDYWEPLCALYHRHLRETVDRCIQCRQLAMQSLLDGARSQALPRPKNWAQANTPEELQKAMAKTYHVLLFGPLARVGAGERIPVTLKRSQPTCADLRNAIAAQYPALAHMLPSCRFAVNHAFAAEDTPLTSDEEIALIGFVSGG